MKSLMFLIASLIVWGMLSSQATGVTGIHSEKSSLEDSCICYTDQMDKMAIFCMMQQEILRAQVLASLESAAASEYQLSNCYQEQTVMRVELQNERKKRLRWTGIAAAGFLGNIIQTILLIYL